MGGVHCSAALARTGSRTNVVCVDGGPQLVQLDTSLELEISNAIIDCAALVGELNHPPMSLQLASHGLVPVWLPSQASRIQHSTLQLMQVACVH